MQVEEKITITMEEYKRYIELSVRMKILVEYIEGEKYSLDKERIKSTLGLTSDVTADV